MTRTLIALSALLWIAAPAPADEKPAPKPEQKADEKAGEKPAEKPAKPEGEQPTIKLLVGKLSRLDRFNEPKLIEALTRLPGVVAAEADRGNQTATIELAAGAELKLSAIGPALRGTGVMMPAGSILLDGSCSIQLKGEMRGARKKRQREYSRADDLRDAMVALPQVQSLTWAGLDRFSLVLIKPLPLKTVQALLARHGSTANGSGLLADVTWVGPPAKRQPSDEERAARKRKNKRKQQRDEGDGGGSGLK